MNHSLKAFEKNSHDLRIDVSIQLKSSQLEILYKWSDPQNSLLHPSHSPKRRHELWKHTCFEFFLRENLSSNKYLEFNFTHDGSWNAYAFEGLRQNMKDLEISSPIIKSEGHSLRIILDLASQKHFLFNAEEASYSVTAVIENQKHHITYWALDHCDLKPNFHDFKAFRKFKS